MSIVVGTVINTLVRVEILESCLTLVLVILKPQKRHHMLPIERASDLLVIEVSHPTKFCVLNLLYDLNLTRFIHHTLLKLHLKYAN